AAARGSCERVPRSRRWQKQVLADAVQAARVRKCGKLDLAHLLRLLLAGKRDADGAVGANRDARGVRRDRDGRLQGISIGCDHISLGVKMKGSRARIGQIPVRHLDLEKSLSLNGQIEWIPRRIEVSLRLNHL